MNQNKSIVSVLMLASLALSACASASTPAPALIAATAIPPTPAPTSQPLPEHVVAQWMIPDPTDIVFGFDSAWVPSRGDSPGGPRPRQTSRIDPASNQIVAVIDGTGAIAKSALVTGDGVWIPSFAQITKIDPQTNTVVLKTPQSIADLAYGFGSLWAPTFRNEIQRIDPATGEVTTTIEFGRGYSDNNNQVMLTAAVVWVDFADAGELIKIDPTTNQIVSKTQYSTLIEQAKSDPAVPAGKATDFIWMSVIDPKNPQGCGLLQIDPISARGVSFLPVGADCNGPAVIENTVWISSENQIEKFNSVTRQIEATIKLQRGIWKLGFGYGSIWVVYEQVSLVQRLDIAP